MTTSLNMTLVARIGTHQCESFISLVALRDDACKCPIAQQMRGLVKFQSATAIESAPFSSYFLHINAHSRSSIKNALGAHQDQLPMIQ
jgi:hypothetical protein